MKGERENPRILSSGILNSSMWLSMASDEAKLKRIKLKRGATVRYRFYKRLLLEPCNGAENTPLLIYDDPSDTF